tara:strand:+ start:10425 stop:11006 length:582 start_codon:yes stop_codon:yes gene_type:complete
MLWIHQTIIGWALILAAISLNRMGPAFKRSKFSSPILLLGLSIILLIQGPGDNTGSCLEEFCTLETYLDFQNFIISSSIWISLALLGIMLIIYGSEWYSKSNPIALIFAWLLIFYSWWTVINIDFYHEILEQPNYLFNYFFFALGILISLFILIGVVRWTEINTPRDPIIDEMDEREKRIVTEIIRRNIRGDD